MGNNNSTNSQNENEGTEQSGSSGDGELSAPENEEDEDDFEEAAEATSRAESVQSFGSSPDHLSIAADPSCISSQTSSVTDLSQTQFLSLGISRNPSGERLAQAHPDVATSCPGPEGTNVHGQQGTCTVEIRSTGSSNTSMETLTLYLENTRRSGGGKLQRPIRQDGTTRRCYATFENAETARRVALRQHTLEGDVLDVRLHPSLNDTPEPACTVSVRNFHVPSTTEEALRNYFETPMSEGGVVTAVEIHTREVRYPVAYVTFQNADAASSVARREHTLNGKLLRVRIHRQPVVLPNILALHGLPSSAETEDLRDFIEVKTGQLVHSVRCGQIRGVALVVFQNDVDLIYIRSALANKCLLGRKLTVTNIEASSTVEVHNLPQVPSLSQETLTNYFENTPRSGGGGVLDVQLLGDRRSALVTFEDTEVTAEVASRRHVFHGQELDICPYFSCLGLSGRRQPSRFGNLQALLSFVVVLLAVFLYFVLWALDFPSLEILVAFH